MIVGVPYDWEIEYLESTGPQWIDLGIKPSDSYIVSIDCECGQLGYHVDHGIFGRYIGTGGKLCYVMAKNYDSRRFVGGWDGITYGDFPVTSFDGNRYVISMSKSVATINGSTWKSYKASAIADDTKTLYLFRVNGNGSVFIGKIYSFSITDSVSGNKVLDFIPVRVGQTGYMYDRISRKLFGNKGTGAFVLGPDVARPVMGLRFMKKVYTAGDYIQKGITALWDGLENVGWGKHDNSAQTWVNLVGNRWNLPLTSAASWGDKCAYSNGTNYLAGLIGSDNIIPPSECVSIEIVASWENRSYPDAKLASLFYSGSSAQNSRSVVWDGDRVAGYMYSSNSYPVAVVSSPGLNNRILISAIYPSTYGPTASIYMNGVKSSVKRNANRTAGATGILVGAYKTASAAPRGWLKGNVYCIRLYSRALTADEIAHNYAVDTARFNLP